jgi:hypothetical protein
MAELTTEIHPNSASLLLFLIAGWELQREYEVGTAKRPHPLYPYSEPLCVAWNALALHAIAGTLTAPPITLTGLHARCARPIGEWLPPSLVPDDFPRNAPILYSGSGIELSETANDYLNQHIYDATDFSKHKLSQVSLLRRFLENQEFVALWDLLRINPWTPKKQAEYVLLRRF